MIQIIDKPREHSVIISVDYKLNTLFTKEYLHELFEEGGRSMVLNFIYNKISLELSSMVFKDMREREIEILLEAGMLNEPYKESNNV